MFIPDSEKEGRKGALKKLLQMMGQGSADEVMAFKKSKEPQFEDEGEKPELEIELEGDDGPSEEEKAQIAELYSKYCM